MKKITCIMLMLVLLFADVTSFGVYAENNEQLDYKLVTLQQRLKDSGKLQLNETLNDYHGEIPVLIALKDSSEYTVKEASLDEIETMCHQIELSQNYMNTFREKVKSVLKKNVEMEIVTYVLGAKLKAELDIEDLKKIATLEEIERISPNFESIPVGTEFKERGKRRTRRALYHFRELKGTGELIAIIDTGFDTGHSDFVMEDTQGAKYENSAALNDVLKKLNEKINDPMKQFRGSWINNKFPYGYNFAKQSPDVMETGNSHGTHVAAIAAASSGYTGQAPKAQILAMSVISGESDLVTPDKYLNAIEQSVLLGASSINISLGIPSSTMKHVGEEVLHAIATAKKQGVLISVSAGNDNYTDDDLQPPKVDQPNYGTISSPALVEEMFAVASLDNDTIRLPFLEVDGTKIPYYPSRDEAIVQSYDMPLELVYVEHATEEELKKYPEGYLKGKAVLIERGLNRFDEKVALVSSKGAKAAIIYDNTESNEWTSMDIHDPNIPAIFLIKNDGLKLKAKLNQKIVLRKQIEVFKLDNAGNLSYFSSWGPTPEFNLKPEITALGGHVWAAQPGNTHADKSGTSMAAPQVAGMIALLQERVKKDDDLNLKFDKNTEKEKLHEFLKNMIMSTAVPHVQAVQDPYASPRKQGAGVMNKDNVLSSYAYVSAKNHVAKINLGSIDTNFDLNFTIHNISKTKNVTFDKIVTTVQTDKIDKKNPSFIVPLGSERIVDDIVLNEKITLAPNETRDIKVSVDFAEKDSVLAKQFINGYYVEGFVRLTSADKTQSDIGLPYIAFRKVDKNNENVAFYDIDVLERPIYDYVDLSDSSKDVPKYYRLANSKTNNPFTSLVSEKDKNMIVLGETTDFDSDVRTFDKNKIAFSPNADKSQDFVQMRGVFISQYMLDHIEVLDFGKNVVYRGENGYSGKIGTLGIIEVGRKNEAHSSDGSSGTLYSQDSKYIWDGKNTQGELQKEGEYTFVFCAKGVVDSAKEQRYEFKVVLDNTQPQVTNVKKENNVITANVEENGSGIRTVQLNYYDIDGTLLQNKTKKVSLSSEGKISIPDEKEVSSAYLLIEDYAGNRLLTSLKALTTDKKGSVSCKVSPNSIKDTDYEIIVTDEDGTIQLNHTELPYGKYKVKLKLKVLGWDFENPDDREQEFEINENTSSTDINFKLNKQTLTKVSLPILTTEAKGNFGMAERPEIVIENENGISMTVQGKVSLGKGCSFDAQLTPGKWIATVKHTDKSRKLFPEELEFEVDASGKLVENKNLPFLYAGPKFFSILPQIECKTDDVSENDITFSVLYQNPTDASHKLNGKEMKDYILNLPDGFYTVKPILPEGYYADPEVVTVDLREKNAAPKFVVYQKNGNETGSFSIQTRVNGELTGNFGINYEVTDKDKKVITDLNNIPYGTYTIKALNSVNGYSTKENEKTFYLGPSTNGKKVVFEYTSLGLSEKTGTIAIYPEWSYMKYQQMNEFNVLNNGKPYRYLLHRLDKEVEDMRMDKRFPGYNARINLENIPYGTYILKPVFDLVGEYCTDKQEVLVTVDRDRVTVDLKYSDNDCTKPQEYGIIVDASCTEATLTPSVQKAKETEKITVTFTVNNPEKEVEAILVNDTLVSVEQGSTVEFYMPGKDVVLNAKVNDKKISHTIEVKDAEYGKVTPNKMTAVSGEGIRLTVDADKGYTVKQILCNGTELDGFEFIMPDEEVVIESVFERTPLNHVDLLQNINVATLRKTDVVTSEQDGEDVDQGKMYVSKEMQEELDTAITKANDVLKNALTQEEVDEANAKLVEALVRYQPKKGTKIPAPPVVLDKSKLEDVLKIAHDIQVGVVISDNGENVPVGTKWVVPSMEERLQNAIKKAQEVLLSATTQEELEEVCENLTQAMKGYVPTEKKKDNDSSSSGTHHSSDSSTSQKDTEKKVEPVIEVVPKQEEKTISFVDVDQTSWYASAVEYVASKKLMQGVGNDKFCPNDALTRAMATQILYHMANRPTTEITTKFLDVKNGDWYQSAVSWATKNHITHGMKDNMFAPSIPITREQLVVMLYHFTKNNMSEILDIDENLGKYVDKEQISNYALPAMKWAIKHHIVKGTKENKLNPKDFCTRAEMAAILQRYVENK